VGKRNIQTLKKQKEGHKGWPAVGEVCSFALALGRDPNSKVLGAEGMARRVMVALCYLAIVFAWVDDSIAACTESPDDDVAAALDNEYLSDHSPLLREIELLSPPTCDIAIAAPLAPQFSAAPVEDWAFTEPGDVCLIIMRC